MTTVESNIKYTDREARLEDEDTVTSAEQLYFVCPVDGNTYRVKAIHAGWGSRSYIATRPEHKLYAILGAPDGIDIYIEKKHLYRSLVEVKMSDEDAIKYLQKKWVDFSWNVACNSWYTSEYATGYIEHGTLQQIVEAVKKASKSE